MVTTVVPVLTGVFGLLLGAVVGNVIGYYKARDEMADKLNLRVSKADCSDCNLRGIVEKQGKDLDLGNETFKEIRSQLNNIDKNVALLAQKMKTEPLPVVV